MTTQPPPKLRGKLEVFDILAQLEAVTATATKLPLTRRAVINPAEIHDLVARLRHALPADLAEAQQIIRFRDTFLAQSQNDAKRIRATAEQEALQRLSESQIAADAMKDAEKIKAAAQQQVAQTLVEADAQARQRIEGADAYAIEVLSKLEEELHTLLLTARRGLDTLQTGHDISSDGEARAAK